eukprot:TRINITY_DN510_c2_g1_i1.p2 TRINITY_DN510_c2_g1~~TRINITY_DN510_c2_g1_i1.p2  ORF type:complete len:104 (+),score=0.04 TRINITY_DN510_c2_g1_i1:243-554(+)
MFYVVDGMATLSVFFCAKKNQIYFLFRSLFGFDLNINSGDITSLFVNDLILSQKWCFAEFWNKGEQQYCLFMILTFLYLYTFILFLITHIYISVFTFIVIPNE